MLIKRLLLLIMCLATLGVLAAGCGLGSAETNYTLGITVQGEGTATPADGLKYAKGTVVDVTQTAAEGWVFDKWAGANGTEVANGKIIVTGDMAITAVFVRKQYQLTVNVDGTGDGTVQEAIVVKGLYNAGTTVKLTAVPSAGSSFDHWTGTLTGNTNPGEVLVAGATVVTAFFTLNPGIGPDPVILGKAGDFAILSKSGISTVPDSAITGDIGVSPILAAGITGFSEVMDATNVFSTSTQVTGKAYAPNYAAPTPNNLTTAVLDMETAYTDAAGRTPDADKIELYTGDLSGKTLTPGVYKWATGVMMTSDVTLKGGPSDTWIFQIAMGITQSAGAKIILEGGALPQNIVWQATGPVTIGAGAHFEGIILCSTGIDMGSLASINGRLLAQTAVTLITNTVVEPN